MKRLMLVLTLVLSLSTFVTKAGEVKVSDQVLDAFNQSFRNATEISWTTVSSLYKVNFNINGEYVTAYYSDNGKMMSLTRSITLRQLPFSLQGELKRGYANCWITDLTEVNSEEGIYYVASLENADSRIVVKSTSDMDWMNVKKINK